MTKETKIICYSLGALGLLVGGYALFQAFRQPLEKARDTTKTPADEPPQTKVIPLKSTVPPKRVESPTPNGNAFPLMEGSQGKRVERLQLWLLRNYGLQHPINGIYTEQVAKAVKRHLKVERISEALYTKLGLDEHIADQKAV